MLQSSLEAGGEKPFLQQQLPEVATEFSAQFAAVAKRSPAWSTLAEFGRRPGRELPLRFLEEALDREAAGCLPLDEPAEWSLIAVPIDFTAQQASVLVLAGRSLDEDLLPKALAVGRALGLGLQITRDQANHVRRVDRLKRTLQTASSFAGVRDSEQLLEHIAEEATRLLACDRASIFLWDRERHELVACPALGVEDRTLRVPDNAGIVGDVIRTGRMVHVADAYSDPRFNQKVDRESGYRTRNLLCGPLRDAAGELIGAFEVINKLEGPFAPDDEEILEQLGVQAAIAVQNAREREQLVRSREQLTERLMQGVRIIGESPAIVALRETVKRLAATDLPVLILGESGTGKEVVAQSLHYMGPRSGHPFVAVNCAALTETLLESELFGHEKGAFTDAREMRRGKFEAAEGGTLFLDEVGDMSLGGQAKLLRVLEQKVITRVGGSASIPINVRVVAATNTDLVEAVRARRFREDLYYRLSVVTQTLPAVRDRPEDILPLAEFFLGQFCKQAGRKTLQLSADARRRLQAHGWPGNVRELRNLMERLAFLNPSDRVEANDLAFILSPDQQSALDPSPDMGLSEATQQFQQEHIRRAIKRVRGNMSEAARLLGLHRSNLYRKMRQLDMQEADEGE
jgi:Nif-specific regulatory protein